MKIRNSFVRATLAASSIAGALALTWAAPAMAGSIAVANASFETPPAGGYPYGCGAACDYSYGDPIPGWTSAGQFGQFQPGPPATLAYFNYVPDGVTVAYSNGGTISQTVGATAVAGVTYTLNVDVGFRHDYPDLGTVALMVGGNTIFANGASPQGSGTWADWTASYTATGADAGGPISIVLTSGGAQSDWDNVRLTSGAVPEPATWAMMLVGFGGLGAAMRSRRKQAAAAA